MNLKELLHSVTTILNQDHPGLNLGVDRFNLVIKLVNYDYFKQWCGLPEQWQLGQPLTTRGWEVAEKNKEALRPFLIPTQNYTVDSNGQWAFPSNFVKLSDVGYFNSITGHWRPVEILAHQEKFDQLGNPITTPEKEYPIAIYENTYLQFYPIDLLNVDIAYFRLPTTPIYALKQENGIDVYDSANSIQFEWAEQFHNDLVRMIIGYLAPASKDANMTQINEQKKQIGV
jgi:hypothetical protein